MTKLENELHLTVEHTINAPIESVYDAWLTPKLLMQFMCPGPGMTTPVATVDAKVGGRFDLIMKNGDAEMPHGGVYKVLDRPNRIEFSWESPFSVEGSHVSLTFKSLDQGTHITLTHKRFPDEESRNNHENGWTAILRTLGATIDT